MEMKKFAMQTRTVHERVVPWVAHKHQVIPGILRIRKAPLRQLPVARWNPPGQVSVLAER